MPTDLPTTAIGLIAFMVIVFGFALKYLTDQSRKSMAALIDEIGKNTATFMTYIEKKNGNLERATQLFTETTQTIVEKMEDQGIRHRDAMVDQNDRHKQMMDDFAGRLENLIPADPKKL